MSVRTRFAPSPTGVLHIGSVRTALFCWLYAHHCDGEFVLRIEDTDPERSTKENVNAILDGMAWLGMHPDEGPHFQSERYDRYTAVSEEWLNRGLAYRCYCTREELDQLREEQRSTGAKTRYDGRCRTRTEPRDGVNPVVRFRNPDYGTVRVSDRVRGCVEFDNAELDDLIILRSDGSPTYNFSVVVDDFDMRISHVIRGDDHLNNTPRQINMLTALESPIPDYAHLPMILGEDGAKLSKRHGAVDIRDFRNEGYLPEALLNYLVRLGWSHGDQEIFSIDEMVKLFDIVDVNQSASTFNPQKLLWVNQQHIISGEPDKLGRELVPYLIEAGLDPGDGPDPAQIVAGFRERAQTLWQMADACRYCYADFAEIDANAVKKHLRPVILQPLSAVLGALSELSEWSEEQISATINSTADSFGISMGKLGQPIRVAVTGGSVSPPIDVTLRLIGRGRSIRRLAAAVKIVEDRAAAG